MTGLWSLQVTGRVQWEHPTLPQTVELDDSGSELFVEPEQERVMPSRSTVLSGTGYWSFSCKPCHHRLLVLRHCTLPCMPNDPGLGL